MFVYTVNYFKFVCFFFQGPSRLKLSKPVIGAIEGHAVAGGMELALMCDLRVVAEDMVMGIFNRRFGKVLLLTVQCKT